MRQVPEILQHSQIASREAHINDLVVAFRSLGDRFDWSDAYDTSSVQVCSGHSQLLHQVGSGKPLATISSKKV